MDPPLVRLIAALLLTMSGSPAPAAASAEPHAGTAAFVEADLEVRLQLGSQIAAAEPPPASGGSLAVLPRGGGWRQAPEYLPIFTASGAHPGVYETLVSPLDLDAALRQFAAATGVPGLPGTLHPQSVVAPDAFGHDGQADRWTIARLFGARRARVVRAPRAESGRVVESWTLISPYPDARLGHLNPGTLLIVLHVDRAEP